MTEVKWPEAQQRVDGELKRLDKETREIKASMKAQGQALHDRINEAVKEVHHLKVELVGEVRGMAATTQELSDNVKAGRARWMAIVLTLVAAVLAMVRSAIF
jgi:predicted  nucleic acid-binding Zn-ribbon protein